MSCILDWRHEVVMSQKESFHGAVKDNYFDVLVRFDRRDDLIELREWCPNRKY